MVETLTVKDIYSAFKQIIYNYDFGDNWEIMLTISEDVDLDDEIVVDKTLKPRLINYDGLNLIEDVGGVSGYYNFLFTIYNLKEVRMNTKGDVYDIDDKFFQPILDIKDYEYYSEDYTPPQMLSWAKSLEWNDKLPPLDKWF